MNEIENHAFIQELPRVDFAEEGLRYIPWMSYGAHPRQYMECIYKESKKDMPVIIWIHGGAWDDEYLTAKYRPEPTICRLAQLGYFVACLEYRLFRHAELPACIDDCQHAVLYLKEHGKELSIDSNRIGLWGESAGAHIACMTGSNYNNLAGAQVHSVVSFYCPSDLLAQIQFNGGDLGFVINALPKKPITAEEMEEHLLWMSPVQYAGKKNLPPFLLMHGDEDDLVDCQESVSYARKLKNAGNDVTLVVVPGQGHGFFQGEKYYDQVIEFFARTLGTEK